MVIEIFYGINREKQMKMSHKTEYSRSGRGIISQAGFTLVELAIVLVIIGLIISSVLVGQDLVRGAELRAAITQYDSYNAAVGTFRGKYNGLPGDIAGATNYGFVGNGDSNGALLGSTSLAAAENVYFWNHLGSSGAALIPGTYPGTAVVSTTIDTQLPATKAGNYWGVYTASGVNYYYLGVIGGTAGVYATTNTLTPIEAQNIDTKVDDGKPARGIVQAKVTHASNADTAITTTAGLGHAGATPGGAFCTVGAATYTAVAVYNTTATTTECNLRFKMPF